MGRRQALVSLLKRGAITGRTGSEEITVYKSLGVAAQDIVTARRVYELACERDVGTLAGV